MNVDVESVDLHRLISIENGGVREFAGSRYVVSGHVGVAREVVGVLRSCRTGQRLARHKEGAKTQALTCHAPQDSAVVATMDSP